MDGKITTVLGEISPNSLHITDAHNHVWIEPIPGTSPGAPVLNQKDQILAELNAYSCAGGSAIVDCQPGGCGRNGQVLVQLSQKSKVSIIACTGFHLPIYYPPDYWLWHASVDEVTNQFVNEIQEGLVETRQNNPVKAGLIKVACEDPMEKTPQHLLEGAANAARDTGMALEIHTEKGGDVENIFTFFENHGLDPHQIILCHMDKRPDFGLHRTLAQAGLMLEYDTFYRPKYNPEAHLWPLITFMVDAGLECQVALATDMADAQMWQNLGKGPGLANFPTQIRQQLFDLGLGQTTIKRLIGENINFRLAGFS